MQQEAVRGVLMVEDEEQLLTLVASFLEQEKYRVFRAADGLEALAIFRAHRQEISVLITDLGLPALGGIELISAVRRESPGMKIIGVSGLGGDDIRRLAAQSGADLFIQKPFHITEIFKAVSVLREER